VVGGALGVARIIPAGAGSTVVLCDGVGCGWDHPRWRGEHAVRVIGASQRAGSSPLARGARGPDTAVTSPARIIPAGAGSTESRKYRRQRARDHPRWRGEHVVAGGWVGWWWGSSPLARGARVEHFLGAGGVRIIPAGAGSTRLRAMPSPRRWDHPRWRGEHMWSTCGSRCSVGSSPLARGAHESILCPGCGHRIIPAGAGSTRCRQRVRRRRTDHPRWRGEHSDASASPVSTAGSSPLARGAPDRRPVQPVRDGIIPAGAGSTSYGPGARPTWADHPRWRGEHLNFVVFLVTQCGSSPLARGAPGGGLPARG